MLVNSICQLLASITFRQVKLRQGMCLSSVHFSVPFHFHICINSHIKKRSRKKRKSKKICINQHSTGTAEVRRAFLFDLHESGVWCKALVECDSFSIELRGWVTNQRNLVSIMATAYIMEFLRHHHPQSLVVVWHRIRNTQHDKHVRRFHFTFRLPYKRRLRWHIQIDLAVTWDIFSLFVICSSLPLYFCILNSLSLHKPICIFSLLRGYMCVCLRHSSQTSLNVFYVCRLSLLDGCCFGCHTYVLWLSTIPRCTQQKPWNKITCWVSELN